MHDRSRLGLLVIALLALGAAPALIGSAQASPARPGAQALVGSRAAAHALPTRRRSRSRSRRPGCGTYCRQAGGFGGGPPGQPQVVIPHQTVRVGRDGVVRLRARCRLAVRRCQGAVLLNDSSTRSLPELGRSDLSLPGHSRPGTIEVALSASGRRLLARRRRISKAFATAAVRRKGVWTSARLILLAPR